VNWTVAVELCDPESPSISSLSARAIAVAVRFGDDPGRRTPLALPLVLNSWLRKKTKGLLIVPPVRLIVNCRTYS
jgi:hypothetical protein